MGGNLDRRLRNVVMLGGMAILWGSVVLGAALYADGFHSTGQEHGDWYWLSSRSHAQWEFVSIPAGGNPHVVLEAFLGLFHPDGAFPEEIEVRFQVGAASGSTRRTFAARLRRVQVNHGSALYFGQVFLSPRELGLGSQLTVRLEGLQSRFSVGVHPSSVRIAGRGGVGAHPEIAAAPEAGRGGGLDEPRGRARSDLTEPVRGSVPTVRVLPDSGSADAPFLAPGVYQGELGGPGTHHAVDMKDAYRVNLRVGQIVTVRVEATSKCVVILLDPLGRQAGRIEGGVSSGLEHRATITGVWHVLILCWVGSPPLTYTMTLHIR